jgi:hypothetical protein
VLVPRLAVADEELQHAVPQRCELEREDDDNDNRREELDGRELRWRAQAGELSSALQRNGSWPSPVTHKITVEDMVDELEEELVDKQEGARAHF